MGQMAKREGYVMNEVEKLRGLLTRCDEYLAEKGVIRDAKLRREIRTALSQQAEPAPSQYSDVVSDGGMDPRNAPPPAQDEREAVEVVAVVKHDSPLRGYTEFMKYESWMADGLSRGWAQLMTVAQHERIVASLTRPAQTEQQPYPHNHPLHKAVFMARESYTGSETFEDGVRGLIAELKDARKAQPEVRRLREPTPAMVQAALAIRPAQTEQEPAFLLEIGSDGEYAVLVRDKSWLRAMRNKREHQEHKLYAAPIAQTDTCPACNGTGEGIDTGDCALVACMCNGTGKLPKE